MKSLISLGDLLNFGFKAIKETWKPTLKYTVWFILLPILYYVVVLGSAFATLRSPLLMIAIMLLATLGFLVGILWASISLYQYMLAYAHGTNMKNWEPKENPLSFVPGLAWIGILMIVPIYAAFGAAFLPLLVVDSPGLAFSLVALLYIAAFVFTIWFSTLASQAHAFLMVDGIRGIAAMKKSMEVVQGRWWSVFARLFVPQLLFQFIIMSIFMAYIIVGLVIMAIFFSGWSIGMSAAFQEGASEGLRMTNMGIGLVGIVFLIVYGLLGLAIQVVGLIAQVLFQSGVGAKVFYSLKESR